MDGAPKSQRHEQRRRLAASERRYYCAFATMSPLGTPAPTLLSPDDPAPFRVLAPRGASRFLLFADHAGQRVPASLRALGLQQSELDRHIGWDIGVAGMTEALSAQLDAFAIVQTYSRLVIDCNRPLHAPGSIAASSDGTLIPGNQDLAPAARAARAAEIFTPYHNRLAAEIEARTPQFPIVISLHSFTPVMGDFVRPWHSGVLYNRDGRFALALKSALEAEGLVVGDNEPYAVSDATDYGVPVHVEPRNLFHVELEVRQDLIATSAGQREWAERLARVFTTLEPAFRHHPARS